MDKVVLESVWDTALKLIEAGYEMDVSVENDIADVTDAALNMAMSGTREVPQYREYEHRGIKKMSIEIRKPVVPKH